MAHCGQQKCILTCRCTCDGCVESKCKEYAHLLNKQRTLDTKRGQCERLMRLIKKKAKEAEASIEELVIRILLYEPPEGSCSICGKANASMRMGQYHFCQSCAGKIR